MSIAKREFQSVEELNSIAEDFLSKLRKSTKDNPLTMLEIDIIIALIRRSFNQDELEYYLDY